MTKAIWSRQMEYAQMRQDRVRIPGKKPKPVELPLKPALPPEVRNAMFTPNNKYIVTVEKDGETEVILRPSRRAAEGELNLWRKLKGFLFGKVERI